MIPREKILPTLLIVIDVLAAVTRRATRGKAVQFCVVRGDAGA